MRLVLTLVAAHARALEAVLGQALEAVASAGRPVAGTDCLGDGAMDIFVDGADLSALRRLARAALAGRPVDYCVQAVKDRRKRLLVADMDSTIIGCECLDELADLAGKKAQVAAITARAMAGEIDFAAALRERVALLAGLPLTALEEVQERVRLNPGARTLVRTMTANGARCVLVSGGFEAFVRRVAREVGFSAWSANRLIDDGAALIGRVAEPILGGEAKAACLRDQAAELGCNPSETVAIGDGANDRPMIEAAGLGVAYRGKPVLRQAADATIDHGDLTTPLYFQGYSGWSRA